MQHSLVTPTSASEERVTPGKMWAIRKPEAKPGFSREQIDIPAIGADEVLVKVAHASVCGTDLHITQWDAWSAGRITPPLTYGHEFAGVVVTTGDRVEDFAEGDRVSAEMHLSCGQCRACRTGKAHICKKVQIFGVDLNGCFADYIALPAKQLVKLPPDFPLDIGACLDSLGNAVHTVTQGDVSGKQVLITGCGPIGLFAIRVAKALGAVKVYASDLSEYRREMAILAGADAILNPKMQPVSQTIKDLTRGDGVDVVLEMSGSQAAILDGLASLTSGGKLVLLGLPSQPITLDMNEHLIFRELSITGVHGRQMFETWFLMLELLSSGQLNIDFMLTHRFALSQFGEAMELVATGQTGKVILTP
jgi:threonine 3-dehydrogenase